MTPRQLSIIAELRCRTEPIQARELERLVGCHRRRVQDAIAELQQMGYKILSSSAGYWLARGDEDAKACREASKTRMRHAIEELRDANRFARWAFELESRQMSLTQ